MDIAERTNGGLIKGIWYLYREFREDAQSWRPSLAMSALSMKIVPDAGSMIRNSARRSCKTIVTVQKTTSNDLQMIFLPQFDHIFRFSLWVSEASEVSVHLWES
jgi:hypothetical protein